jgi:hypothetical protein
MTPQTSLIRRREGVPASRREAIGVDLRERAAREARRVAEMERVAWRAARDRCLQLEKIRRNAQRRIAAIVAGSSEKFAGERAWAEAALREVARCEPRDSAAYTIISFAGRRDRLRYLRGSDADREALVRETLARGGVRDDRGRFQEILQ